MREIKFRIWNKICNRFLNIDYSYPVAITNQGKIGVLVEDFDFEEYTKDELKNIIISEYTGIKDMNGKEIYEGDILLSTTEDGVFLISIGFGYSEKDNDILGAFKLKIEKQLALSQYFEDFDDNLIKLVNKYNIPIEENNIKCINDGWWIVGNVYENPELLGDDKNVEV